MALLPFLQQRFGFTRNEVKVILFLAVTFAGGLALRWYRSREESAPSRQFEYSQGDSIFVARSRSLSSMSPEGNAARAPKTPPVSGPVNINTATADELNALPGIGPKFAERIVAYRTEHGPFSSVNDLARVRGIGRKKMQELRSKVRVH